MKKFRLLLLIVVVSALSSMFSCNGASENKEVDTVSKKEIQDEPVIEETDDTTAVIDSLKK